MTLLPKNIWQCPQTFLVFQDLGGRWVLLASHVERPEVLLNSHGAQGGPTQNKPNPWVNTWRLSDCSIRWKPSHWPLSPASWVPLGMARIHIPLLPMKHIISRIYQSSGIRAIYVMILALEGAICRESQEDTWAVLCGCVTKREERKEIHIGGGTAHPQRPGQAGLICRWTMIGETEAQRGGRAFHTHLLG